MTTEKVIDILKGIKDGTACLMPNMPEDGEKTIDIAIKAVEQSEPHWHPVSEQPQEEDDYLLLTYEKYKHGTFKRIIIGAWNSATKEWLEEYGDMYRAVNHPVAWISKDELLLLKGYKEDVNHTVLKALPPWIPTSERLPKINEDILLSYFDEVTIGWLNGDGSWSIYDGWECVSADEISAWIPLPEAYKPSVIEKCLREKRYE